MLRSYYAKQIYLLKNREKINALGRVPSFLFIGLINVYQWTISPDHGILSLYTTGKCKFRPTCSEYTKRAIKNKGVTGGFKTGWKQIKKCH